MAAIVLVGPDSVIHAELRDALLHTGYRVLDARDREAALRLLSSASEHMLAILLATLPETDAEELLGAVAVDDRLSMPNAYLLMAADPMHLSTALARRCDELGIPVIAQPRDAQDRDNWADALDAVRLAMRHFPDTRDDSALD